MKPAYKHDERKETLQDSSNSWRCEKIGGNGSKWYDIDETIKMLEVEHYMLEKQAGMMKVNNMISTRGRDDLSKKVFLKHIKKSSDYKESRNILQKRFAEHMLEEKTV